MNASRHTTLTKGSCHSIAINVGTAATRRDFRVENGDSCGMPNPPGRIFFFLLRDWTWWLWLVTAILLALGLAGFPIGYISAIVLTAIQVVIFLIREQDVLAFSVQLRLAYLALLLLCLPPAMNWLYWLPTIGTFALNIFGYCLMARFLSLLPWNQKESLSLNLIFRTFFSRPRLPPLSPTSSHGCAGSLCTIEAQVQPEREPHR